MFNEIFASPHVITSPELADGNSYEVELVGALDVSQYKTAALVMRMHQGHGGLDVKLRAYKRWPFQNGIGVRFQDRIGALVDSDTAVGTDDDGKLLATAFPAEVCAPMLRIVVELKANGVNVSAGATVTISAGVVLLEA